MDPTRDLARNATPFGLVAVPWRPPLLAFLDRPKRTPPFQAPTQSEVARPIQVADTRSTAVPTADGRGVGR